MPRGEKVRLVGSSAVIEQLKAAGSGVIAFDGDGTLWTGDVGEDVFTEAVRRQLVREDAGEALRDMAECFGVDPTGDANSIAARIFGAYQVGRFPEREVCEMMTWCFAGWSVESFRSFVADVLKGADIERRRIRELEPIVVWARRSGIRCVVISASPQIVVEEAVRMWDIGPNDVAASPAAFSDDGRLLPRLSAPTPYAEAKLAAGRRLFGEAPWLAAFGDNVFDLDMLAEAKVSVGVRPKAALLERLHEVADAVVLARPG